MNSPKTVIRQRKIQSFKSSNYILKCTFRRLQFLQNKIIFRIELQKIKFNDIFINQVFVPDVIQPMFSPCVHQDLLMQFRTHTKQSHISCQHNLKTENNDTESQFPKKSNATICKFFRWEVTRLATQPWLSLIATTKSNMNEAYSRAK